MMVRSPARSCTSVCGFKMQHGQHLGDRHESVAHRERRRAVGFDQHVSMQSGMTHKRAIHAAQGRMPAQCMSAIRTRIVLFVRGRCP
jgi:hypothetical protein